MGNTQETLLGKLEHPKCSICNRIAGIQIACHEDRIQIKFNPFDHRFDTGVSLFCPECKQSFNSMTAVDYYRALATFRANVERLAKLFGLYPPIGARQVDTSEHPHDCLPNLGVRDRKDQS